MENNLVIFPQNLIQKIHQYIMVYVYDHTYAPFLYVSDYDTILICCLSRSSIFDDSVAEIKDQAMGTSVGVDRQ